MIELYFEMAAAGFFALLFFSDLVKRQLQARRTVAFQVLLCALMLSSFFVVGATIARVYESSLEVNALAQAFGLYAEVLCFACFHSYILSVAYQLRLDSSVFLSECVLFAIVTVLV